MSNIKFKYGQRVLMKVPGSWVDGLEGTIIQDDIVTSTDQVTGHVIRVPGHGITVVPPHELSLVEE